MIKVKDLTVKNFMSVGNQTQAVDFSTRKFNISTWRKLRPRR